MSFKLKAIKWAMWRSRWEFEQVKILRVITKNRSFHVPQKIGRKNRTHLSLLYQILPIQFKFDR